MADGPLHFAAHGGRLKEVCELLDGGDGEVNALGPNGWSALLYAAGQGHAEVVRLLLSRGALLSQANSVGDTALHIAAQQGYVAVVRAILDCAIARDVAPGMAMEARNGSGETPLIKAAQSGHVEVCELLLRSGADPAGADLEGRTAADLAGIWCAGNEEQSWRVQAIRVMLDDARDARAAATANTRVAQGPKCSYNTIHQAVRANDVAAVQAMLRAGAVHCEITETATGMTPLSYAAQLGLSRMTELLIQRGASAFARDVHGWTPLHHAAAWNRSAVIGLILDAQNDPRLAANAAESRGLTPLHLAAQFAHPEAVEALLARGASALSVDHQGRPPIAMASHRGVEQMLRRAMTPCHRSFSARLSGRRRSLTVGFRRLPFSELPTDLPPEELVTVVRPDDATKAEKQWGRAPTWADFTRVLSEFASEDALALHPSSRRPLPPSSRPLVPLAINAWGFLAHAPRTQESLQGPLPSALSLLQPPQVCGPTTTATAPAMPLGCPMSPYDTWDPALPALDPMGSVAMAYVHPDSEEFHLVRSHWVAGSQPNTRISLPATASVIPKRLLSVLRVQHALNEGTFRKVREVVYRQRLAPPESRDLDERLLWHGTRSLAALKGIVHGMAKIVFCQRGMWGKGLYFSSNPNYVDDGYALDLYSHVDNRMVRVMLLFHVIVGDSTVGRTMAPPPPKPSTPFIQNQMEGGWSPVTYETLTNDKLPPDIFVSTFDSQAVLRYVVTYTRDPMEPGPLDLTPAPLIRSTLESHLASNRLDEEETDEEDDDDAREVEDARLAMESFLGEDDDEEEDEEEEEEEDPRDMLMMKLNGSHDQSTHTPPPTRPMHNLSGQAVVSPVSAVFGNNVRGVTDSYRPKRMVGAADGADGSSTRARKRQRGSDEAAMESPRPPPVMPLLPLPLLPSCSPSTWATTATHKLELRGGSGSSSRGTHVGAAPLSLEAWAASVIAAGSKALVSASTFPLVALPVTGAAQLRQSAMLGPATRLSTKRSPAASAR